jgi:hypothetical protein
MSFIQYNNSNLAIAIQAAQTQLIITFKFSLLFQVIFSEFIIQARQTIAVQC